jgi:hypothetical protein
MVKRSSSEIAFDDHHTSLGPDDSVTPPPSKKVKAETRQPKALKATTPSKAKAGARTPSSGVITNEIKAILVAEAMDLAYKTMNWKDLSDKVCIAFSSMS